MIERILAAYRESTFDFEVYANPDDPMRGRFPQWKAYYRMKWAIARAIAPHSVFEFGVRYGYSAIAFLDAAPGARYTGLDLDCDRFGGAVGALQWARKITRGLDSHLIVADSQTLDRLPEDAYDLVHVDGQQDGDGTYHDLELALAAGRFVLLDGCFHTDTNLYAGATFVRDYRHRIEWALTIPGTYGELLIRVATPVAAGGRGAEIVSSDLRQAYDRAYYLQDCGGWEQFETHAGTEVRDPRQQAVFAIALPQRGDRVLDLGCGRGEIAFQAARYGADVTGVDYSQAAIDIARASLADQPAADGPTRFVCADLSSFAFDEPFDKVIASDLIEHLAAKEVDDLYARVAQNLAVGGSFVVHTYPNLWFYTYELAAKRRAAARLGCFLSPNPRSAAERLMHINEQSPRQLRRQLRRYFDHVVLWFGSPEDPSSHLVRRFGKSEMRGARDLFAVASQSPIAVDELRDRLLQRPLAADIHEAIHLRVDDVPPSAACGGTLWATAKVVNESGQVVSSGGATPLRCAYHLRGLDGAPSIFEGARTALPVPIPSGQALEFRMQIVAPREAGRYLVEPRLVQEQVAWWEESEDSQPLSIEIAVG